MSRSKISDNDKLRLVKAVENGEDFVLLAHQLKINSSTARNIVSNTRRMSGIISRQRDGARINKMDDEMTTAVCQLMEFNTQITTTTKNFVTKANHNYYHNDENIGWPINKSARKYKLCRIVEEE